MVPGKLQNIRMTIDSRRLALEHAGPLAGDGADHKSWKSLGSGLPNGVEPALPFENPSALPPPPRVAVGTSLKLPKHQCPHLPNGVQNPYPTHPSWCQSSKMTCVTLSKPPNFLQPPQSCSDPAHRFISLAAQWNRPPPSRELLETPSAPTSGQAKWMASPGLGARHTRQPPESH